VWLEAADAPPHVSAAVTHPIHEPTRRAASKTLNRFSPERPTAFNDPAWIFEPKHDGCRARVYLSPDDCIIRSKRGHTFRRFGALAWPLRELVAARTAILDETFSPSIPKDTPFMDLLRGTGRLVYAAFEILWLGGRDVRALSLTRRKR
jgi:ATP-dependent DNA ligase